MKKQELDKPFWDLMYRNNTTGWDMGEASPAFKVYVQQISNKNAKFLIPGAGNAHEADFLLQNGFTNISIVDISSEVTRRLKDKYSNNPSISIYNEDFFTHEGQYDYIFEQTFFCALDMELRPDYVEKMAELLTSDGKLIGLLFDKEFPHHPPFGGSKKEYEQLFEPLFKIHKMERCYHSHPARDGAELWINLQRMR